MKKQQQYAPDMSVLKAPRNQTYGQRTAPKRYRGLKYHDWVRFLDEAYEAGFMSHSAESDEIQTQLRKTNETLREELRELRKSFIRSLTLNDLLLEKHGYGRD